ncbi:helix-turn-helix domain-containing protein [Nocardia sp. NPDC049707]|uniref:IclR family transcriptional regulator n=1 Tax=Nocardia sp. NPDC049707 TaxID=3154735 RepID=UPI0034345160
MLEKSRGSAGSQTLSRGIRLLEILAAAGRGMTIDELAESLGVHRSVAYRLLRTLEDHGLIARDPSGRIALGAGLAALASGVSRDLQQAALPELRAAADELGMTCLLVVRLDRDEAVTLTSAAPEHSVAVTYRPGHRHPLTRGGPGKAILLELPQQQWPHELHEELTRSRARGFAVSHDEVVPSLRSVAVPLVVPGQPAASIAAIHVSLPRPEAEIAERLTAAAEAVARTLGG